MSTRSRLPFCYNMRWDSRTRPAVAAAFAALLAACGSGDAPAVRVTVPPGATMRTAAESLHHAGVIRSPRLFQLYAKVRRSDRGIKAGTYLLQEHESWGSVLSALRSGRGIVSVITVPEGFTLS